MVSIIIPYYNRPEKLNRCLRSIFEQTYTNFEIIVVDDCSPKPPIIEIDTIIYKRNKTNKGAGISRNVGLELAKGEYISFLDCDDYWHPDFLSLVIGKFKEQPQNSMVYTNGVVVDENEKIVKLRRNKRLHITSIIPTILMQGRPWGTGGCVWKKDSIGAVKWIAVGSWEDYAFDIAVAVKNNKVAFVEGELVYYDDSGTDKLSNQNKIIAIIEKNKALQYISTCLFSSEFRKDTITKKAITIQLLNSIIALVHFKSNKSDLVDPVVMHLKKWNGFYFINYIKCIMYFPDDLKLRLLRKVRGKLQSQIK